MCEIMVMWFKKSCENTVSAQIIEKMFMPCDNYDEKKSTGAEIAPSLSLFLTKKCMMDEMEGSGPTDACSACSNW